MIGATCRDASKRPHLGLERPGDRALFFDAPRPQRRASDRQPLVHDGAEVDFCTRAAEEADLNQAAVHRQAFDVALQVVAADDVENDVDARASPVHSRTICTKSAAR